MTKSANASKQAQYGRHAVSFLLVSCAVVVTGLLLVVEFRMLPSLTVDGSLPKEAIQIQANEQAAIFIEHLINKRFDDARFLLTTEAGAHLGNAQLEQIFDSNLVLRRRNGLNFTIAISSSSDSRTPEGKRKRSTRGLEVYFNDAAGLKAGMYLGMFCNGDGPWQVGTILVKPSDS